ncbi:MAG: protein arginine kinase [Firmicutes bacterium]|jgi:protein arginine kinase|nr:protein arginine kinase [Bacillota bacterium]
MEFGFLNGDGPSSLLVLSSRIRIARNLKDYPFPYRATETLRKEILEKTRQAVQTEEALKILQFMELDSFSALEKQVLLENHLVSPNFIQESKGKGIFLHLPTTISMMVNEEDHLRVQCLTSGLNLEKGWSILNRLDDLLENHLSFAFHESWGYLSAFPTNLGTGLRASVLLHLPALVFLQAMPGLIQSLNQMGIVVRGFYGEGTESQGYFFQISNAFSLGPSEEEIVSRMSTTANQVIQQELESRERMKKNQPVLIIDRIWRSFSILKSARLINSAEAMEHLSLTRMGVQMGILPEIPVKSLNELMRMTRSANLQKELKEEVDALKRDEMRADYLRNSLANFS